MDPEIFRQIPDIKPEAKKEYTITKDEARSVLRKMVTVPEYAHYILAWHFDNAHWSVDRENNRAFLIERKESDWETTLLPVEAYDECKEVRRKFISDLESGKFAMSDRVKDFMENYIISRVRGVKGVDLDGGIDDSIGAFVYLIIKRNTGRIIHVATGSDELAKIKKEVEDGEFDTPITPQSPFQFRSKDIGSIKANWDILGIIK